MKKIVDFQSFKKPNFVISKFLKIGSSTNLPWSRFCRFDVYWTQTDKQTDRQAKYIYISRQDIYIIYICINYTDRDGHHT